MRTTQAGRRAQGGYTYIVVLVLLAVLSMAAALTLEVTETSARRSAEAELLAIGKEFEKAFASYHRQSPAGARRFPDRIEDLARDPRVAGTKRHLRRAYIDPLTHEAWGTVPAPGGGIMAVYSTAPGQPYRESAVTLAVPPAASAPGGASARSYADWRFGYDPATELRDRNRIILPTPAPPAGSGNAGR